MTRHISVKRLQLLMIGRLFVAAAMLLYAQFAFPAEAIVFYVLIAVITVLSIADVLWLITGSRLRLLAVKQVICDLILEGVLVYYTGGADSFFATIFMLTILAAGYVLSPRSSFYVAAGSGSVFILSIVFQHYQTTAGVLSAIQGNLGTRQDLIYLFYATYVRVTVFFIVAFLTYYFSGTIRKLESQMQIQERLVFLGEVVSSIAHEIRNPLTSISGSVELIEKRIHNKLNRNQIKLMDSVVEESERVKIIFNGLLDYSRVPELCCETVVVEEFLDRILLLLKHQEEFNKHIEVTRRYKGKKIQMTADPEYLQQAMTNIVLNSIQAMPDGGQLDIDCERHIEGVKILTQDTGKGMSKKELQSLFMPFKTTKRNGTGLGMAHAYKVVNQHGGKLTVHSRKHKGTQVELFLPIV